MRDIRYGGQLNKGDFIAVSGGNYIQFGWYLGEGKNTIQWINISIPAYMKERYDDHVKNTNKYWAHKFKKGFTINSLIKEYFDCCYRSKAIKINNPIEMFTDSKDLEEYMASRQVLVDLKFLSI